MHYPQLTWSGVGILLKLWKKCEPCTLVRVGWRECSLCAVTTKAMRLERTTISPTKFLKPKRHSVNHIWKFLTVLRFTHVMMSYSVRCAAAVQPPARAHALVKMQHQWCDPNHPAGPQRAASKPPAQKPSPASVWLCLLSCLVNV